MNNNTQIKKASSLKILQITVCPFPPEIRVVKEGLSLLKAGYGSAVMCPPIPGRPAEEEWNGIKIFRPEVLKGDGGAHDKLLMQTSFFSYAWYRALKQVISKYKPDVIHVHDIWLGRTAFLVRTNQKIIIDLHENMPAAVVEYQASYAGLFKLFNQAFKSFRRVSRLEKALLTKSDGVFVVVDEARQRVQKAYPELKDNKVINIENLESKRFLNQDWTNKTVIEKDHFSILYIGGFGPHRGLETLIRAMHYIKIWDLNVKVHLIGARECVYLEKLRNLINELGVSEFILIQPWVRAEEVLAYIKQADVGVVPHHSNPHTNNTIPHKLYQYMMAGTAVLVSSSPPLARTVMQANAGKVFKAGDDKDCANKIREMYDDSVALNLQVENGLNYVFEQGHNWEEESAPTLIDFYEQLLN